MKKSILFALSVALVSTAMTSCSKSSKGKMEGDWTIESSQSKYTSTNGSSNYESTETVNGAIVTDKTVNGSSSNTDTGAVNEASWIIGKDGTWSKKTSYTYTETFGGVTTTYNYATTSAGNWDFLIGVNDDYKKKERVIFNTLNESSTDTETTGSFITTTTDGQTYKDGENSMVYVITESKNKSLTMNSEGGGVSSSGGSYTTSESYTMVQD